MFGASSHTPRVRARWPCIRKVKSHMNSTIRRVMRCGTLVFAFVILIQACGGITVVDAALSEEMIRAEWPETDFTVAYDSFSKGDSARAAYEIRKGSQLFKLAAERSSGKIRNDLETSYQELQKLADSIEKGTVRSPGELNHVFARAHLALAEYYRKQLQESWLARSEEKV